MLFYLVLGLFFGDCFGEDGGALSNWQQQTRLISCYYLPLVGTRFNLWVQNNVVFLVSIGAGAACANADHGGRLRHYQLLKTGSMGRTWLQTGLEFLLKRVDVQMAALLLHNRFLRKSTYINT